MKHHIAACALIIIFPAYSAHLTDNASHQSKERSVVSLFYEKIRQYEKSETIPQKKLPTFPESEFKELIASFKTKGQDINGNYPGWNDRPTTPLIMALQAKLPLIIIQELINAGADVNQKDVHHYTPLVEAVRCNNRIAVELLLKNNACPNAIDPINKSPILHNCSFAPSAIPQLLLKYGAEINACDRLSKKTALHVSTNFIHPYFFLYTLLNHDDLDVNAKDKHGNTPLHFLTRNIVSFRTDVVKVNNLVNAMKALISAGANLCEKNNAGETCISRSRLKDSPHLSDLRTFLQEQYVQKQAFTVFRRKAFNGVLIWSFTDKNEKTSTATPPRLPLEIIEKIFNNMQYSWKFKNLLKCAEEFKNQMQTLDDAETVNNYAEFMKAIEAEQIAFEAFADFRALLEKQ